MVVKIIAKTSTSSTPVVAEYFVSESMGGTMHELLCVDSSDSGSNRTTEYQSAPLKWVTTWR